MNPTSPIKTSGETESPSSDKHAVDRVGYHSEREYIFADSLDQHVKLLSMLLQNL